MDAGDDRRGVGTIDERPGKRVRRQNFVTNASSFGDIGYAAVGDAEGGFTHTSIYRKVKYRYGMEWNGMVWNGITEFTI